MSQINNKLKPTFLFKQTNHSPIQTEKKVKLNSQAKPQSKNHFSALAEIQRKMQIQEKLQIDTPQASRPATRRTLPQIKQPSLLTAQNKRHPEKQQGNSTQKGLIGNTSPDRWKDIFKILSQTSLSQKAKNDATIALKETTVAKDSPYLKHIEDIRTDLKKQGLPTSAEGVKILILDYHQHGEMVTRAAASEQIGLGKGADIELYKKGFSANKDHVGVTPEQFKAFREERDDLGSLLSTGKTVSLHADATGKKQPKTIAQSSFNDIAKYCIREQISSLNTRRNAVAMAKSQAPNDGKTTIVNMSWGMSPSKTILLMTERAMEAPKGSALHAEITKLLGREPSMKGVKEGLVPPDFKVVAEHILKKATTAWKTPEHQAELAHTKKQLTSEVAEGRKKGLLFIHAAGNDHKFGIFLGNPELSTPFSTGIDGFLTVGGSQPNAKESSNFGSIMPESSNHAEVSAPGVMPVSGKGRTLSERFMNQPTIAKEAKGTSFASPYIAGVAALMIKSNPSITPDQIESILTSPQATTDILGTTRDGVGYINPVNAVKMAKELANH